MRAAIFHERRRIEAGERPDPSLREPTDAIVRVVVARVCGPGLWYYRGDPEFAPGPIGHATAGFRCTRRRPEEAVRVPLANSAPVAVPGSGHSDEMTRSLLSLSDVMATGRHAAVGAQVKADQRTLLDAQRSELVRLRDTGEVPDGTMHALIRELDLEDQRLER